MLVGEWLSHYRIDSELGRGGMGQVVQAWDSSLRRHVALKFLLDKDRLDSRRRDALVREARSAARLDHPYICKVLEVVQSDDHSFIAMELVEGETLSDRLVRGALPRRDALRTAIEVAEALQLAHEKGVLHRDLKPSNIMLTTQGHVKVMDFGLAGRLPMGDPGDSNTTQTLSSHQHLKGTWTYMSPEQARGDPLDGRSDIFALGILLFEMLTGRHPFARGSSAEVVAAIQSEPPALDLLGDDTEDEVVRHVVGKMLAKEREERQQSAGGVLADLQAIRRGSREMAIPQPSRPRRGWLRPALALAGVVIAASVLWWIFGGGRELDFTARSWIVVGDLENLTGNELLEEPLERGFRVALGQSRHARVLPESEMRRVLARMGIASVGTLSEENALEICKREGIGLAVLGSALRAGSAYQLAAEVRDCQTEAVVLSWVEAAESLDDILPALERLARKVRGGLGESLAQIEATTRPLQRVTTTNLEALRSYSLALELMGSARDDEAIPLLEHAVELDPAFAMAHARLASLYGSIGLNPRKAEEHTAKALDHPERLTEFEEIYVRGTLAWLGTYPEALEAWNLMTRLFPDESVGHHNLGIVRWTFENDYGSAAESFARSTELRNPRRFVSYHHLGYSQLGLERLDGAVASFETAWSMEKNPLMTGLGDGFFARREHDRARDFYRQALAFNQFSELHARFRLADLEVDRGRLAAGFALYEEGRQRAQRLGVAHAENQFRWAGLLCRSALESGEELDNALDREIALLDGLSLESSEMVVGAARFAGALAQKGRWREAQELQEGIELRASEHGAPAWKAQAQLLQAEIDLARDQPRRAIEALLRSIELADGPTVRFTLARAYRAAGEADAAVAELSAVAQMRGRAFANATFPVSRTANLLALAHAPYELAVLHEEAGDEASAREAYGTFLARLADEGSDLPAARAARRRFAELEGSQPDPVGDQGSKVGSIAPPPETGRPQPLMPSTPSP